MPVFANYSDAINTAADKTIAQCEYNTRCCTAAAISPPRKSAERTLRRPVPALFSLR